MIKFNKKFIEEELENLIPQKIKDLDIKFESDIEGIITPDVYGWVRFDGDKLNALYLELRSLNFEPIAYGEKSVIIKFNVIGGGYEFDSIYKFPKEEVEHRFDSDLNFIAEYKHYDTDEELTDDYEFCAKLEDGKKIESYIGYKAFSEGKSFSKFFETLRNKGIVEGGDDNQDTTFFFKKGNKDMVYLILEPPLDDIENLKYAVGEYKD